MSYDNEDESEGWFEDFWRRPRFRRGFKRGPPGFDWFNPFGAFRDFDRMFERMFEEMSKDIPKEFIREEKLPDGSVVRSYGPVVYGYSVSVGPDGKPVVREFGNVKPSRRLRGGVMQPALEVSDVREPLVDVIRQEDTVKVVAELPGVEKSDIKLDVQDNALHISVDTPQRKYRKTVKLPTEVDPDVSKAQYRNGVLEVNLKALKPSRPQGKQIKIE